MDQKVYLQKGQEILKRFHELTYEAYFVGGVVRDYVLKCDFVDIDITTSATPQEVQKFFPNVDMTFEKDGCVIIKDEGYEFEVSTFKKEEYTSISRHPSTKYYSSNLSDDIERRDYTINALAMTENLKVVDLCNGLKDLKRKRINIIGRAKKRFKEDPLRIMRGFELIARFGYHFNMRTKEGIKTSATLVSNINDAKLNEKMIIIFKGKYGKKTLRKMMKLKVAENLKDYSMGIPLVYKNFNKLTLEEKFALCYYLAGKIPQNTSFDRVTFTKIKTIIKILKELGSEKITREHVFHYGIEVLKSVDRLRVLTTEGLKSSEQEIEKIGHSMPINSLSEMEFKGNNVLELTNGETGPFVSEVLESLRQKVVLGELKNNFKELQDEAKKILIDKDIIVGQKESIRVVQKRNNEELEKLKNQYYEEFDKLLKANLELLIDDTYTDEEISETKKQVEGNIKKILLKKNPKYNRLEEGGLI